MTKYANKNNAADVGIDIDENEIRSLEKEIEEIIKPLEKTKRSDDMALFVEFCKMRGSIGPNGETIKNPDEWVPIASQKEIIKVRNKLASNNQALVTYIVNKYYNNKLAYKKFREDLLQEGTIGLMSAIDGFDPNKGYKFSTYGTWWIRQAVNNYVINVEPLIHVPSHVRTQQNKIVNILKNENRTFQSLIDGNINNMMIDCGEHQEPVTKKMVSNIQHAMQARYISSMEAPPPTKLIGGTVNPESGSLKEVLMEESPAVDKYFDQTKLINIFRDGINHLCDRERFILLLRFDIIKPEQISVRTKSNLSGKKKIKKLNVRKNEQQDN